MKQFQKARSDGINIDFEKYRGFKTKSSSKRNQEVFINKQDPQDIAFNMAQNDKDSDLPVSDKLIKKLVDEIKKDPKNVRYQSKPPKTQFDLDMMGQ